MTWGCCPDGAGMAPAPGGTPLAGAVFLAMGEAGGLGWAERRVSRLLPLG